ncbi:hypothetical protein A7K73_09060 [Candidatus Methylacidiphilum fumarolicum]|nr:hypothetical protein A7K73_09060 [Candidatus Methylacidiphilum fumarolicum]TFE71624.1 hypothetical protein A7K72_10630 [Candidatus Methylacidiphilum fumarolicum]TFE75343.1 hypothetical protein A7D33_01800 [Candidatus Methylacidiphilum fumarolicum]
MILSKFGFFEGFIFSNNPYLLESSWDHDHAPTQNILLEHPTVQGPGFLKLLPLSIHDYERECNRSKIGRRNTQRSCRKKSKGISQRKKVKKEVSSKKSGRSLGILPGSRILLQLRIL